MQLYLIKKISEKQKNLFCISIPLENLLNFSHYKPLALEEPFEVPDSWRLTFHSNRLHSKHFLT